MDNIPIVFLVGAGRSGTTAVSEALGMHPMITHWYEPYFIWDAYIGSGIDDVRTADNVTPQIQNYLRKEFKRYLKKSGKNVLIEKSPENCLRIPLLQAIFPEARWIHLIRDGRDTILSINKEWHIRRQMVEQRDLKKLWSVVMEALSLQPYWRNRRQLIWFELQQHIRSGFRTVMNKSRWKGQFGYGTRFPGWEDVLKKTSDLQFNALQWKHCLEFSLRDLAKIPKDNIHTIRYETMSDNPENELKRIFRFIGVNDSEAGRIAPSIIQGNYGKWQRALDYNARKEIAPIINNLLMNLEYINDVSWVGSEK